MDKLTVVKIGGNVVDDPAALAGFIADFVKLDGPKILVHGGGKEATRLSKRLEMPTTMIDGRRVTDRDTLDIVTMVYAGLVNKRVVSALQAAGCNAAGLTGADGCAITATRRPAEPIDYGYVGDLTPDGVNVPFFSTLTAAGIVPVVCAIMHDGHGTLLNCNADSVASAVATGMAKVSDVDLVYCFEKKGVLRDVDDEDSVIGLITPSVYPALRADGVITKGMIPKIDNALASLDLGVASVRICHSSDLLTGSGTSIRKDADPC